MASPETIKTISDHLLKVLREPTAPLDQALLEHLDNPACEALDDRRRSDFLNLLSEVLPNLQQDPAPVTQLIQRVIRPDHVKFQDVLKISPPVQFELGLETPLASISSVTLHLLAKAQHSLTDINWVAAHPGIVLALVSLWLKAEDTAVAQLSERVLIGLLLDRPDAGAWKTEIDPATYDNLMYRRIFRDKDIYDIFFSVADISRAGQDGLSRNTKTLAQGRLLHFLLQVRNSCVRCPQMPDVEKNYGGHQDSGLLGFAVKTAADNKDDELMFLTFIDFCKQFIRNAALGEGNDFSPELAYLKNKKVHELCASGYFEPEWTSSSWLQLFSAEYIAEYCWTYRDPLRKDLGFLMATHQLLLQKLYHVDRNRWISGPLPTGDLHVLVRLPHDVFLASGVPSVIDIIPPFSTQAGVYETLGALFDTFGLDLKGRAAARANYFIYLKAHPDLWENVIKAAETVANLDCAVAANHMIRLVVDAEWEPLPMDRCDSLPTESWLATRCNNSQALPATGIEAILAESTSTIILPYLMRPATTFSGVGGAQSAVWVVANCKHEVLEHFNEQVKKRPNASEPDMLQIISTLTWRINQGPMGAQSRTGGEIGTMGR